ncbi:MAG TPA: GspH/FimT family pseudopilin [Woeseiaceae bacterium]|nr:GspH/FimT family pseudopilin [Woeseiaceae bacterium]
METRQLSIPQAGFTLYELLITMVIVGVVLSFGIANLGDFTRNSRMTATANDLHAAFHLARSESSRAKDNITICASANSMDPAAQCGGTWDQGFIVFEDQGAGNLLVDGTDVILRRVGPVATGVTMNFENDARYFSYGPTGLGRGNVAGPAVSRVIMCDHRGNVAGAANASTARLFVVTPLGRAAILREIGQIAAADATIGATCP